MLKQLPAAFLYPVAGANGLVFVLASVLYGIFLLATGMPSYLALGAYCAGFGYLVLHLRNVVLSTVKGEDDAPAWPGVEDVHLLRPSTGNLSLLLILGIPALVWLFFDLDKPIAGWVTAAVAFVYLPIGLLVSAVLDESDALTPSVLGRLILAAPTDYLLLLVATAIPIAIAVVAASFSAESLVLNAVLAVPSALYALLFLARIAGMFYRTHRVAIGWDV
jgi:hypothetical protein